jgi:hypothetical protein
LYSRSIRSGGNGANRGHEPERGALPREGEPVQLDLDPQVDVVVEDVLERQEPPGVPGGDRGGVGRRG